MFLQMAILNTDVNRPQTYLRGDGADIDMNGSTVPNSSLTRNILSSWEPEKPTMRHGLRVTLDRLDL